METGQLFMMQVPAGSAAAAVVTASAQVTLASETEVTPFAGLLAGLSTQVSAAKGSALLKVAESLPDAKPGSANPATDIALPLIEMPISLLTEAQAESAEQAKSAEQKQDQSENEKHPEVLMTQEVVLSASGAQLALIAQVIGRMPGSEISGDISATGDAENGAETATRKVQLRSGEAVESRGGDVSQLVPLTKTSVGTEATAGIDSPVVASGAKVEKEGLELAKNLPSETAANGQQQLRKDHPSPATPAMVETQLKAQAMVKAEASVRTETAVTGPDGIGPKSAQSVENALLKVTSQQLLETYSRIAATASASQTATNAMGEQCSAVAVSAAQITPQDQGIAVDAGIQPAITADNASRLSARAVADPVTLSVPASEPQHVVELQTSELPVASPEVNFGKLEVTEPAQRVQHLTETGLITAVPAAKKGLDQAHLERNQHQSSIAAVQAVVSTDSLIADAVKEVSPTAVAGEIQRDEMLSPPQGITQQVHQYANLQLTSQTSQTAGTPASNQADPVKAEVVHQVVNQLKEHLGGNEIKQGAEQIAFRLSPENLGEIKINLRMENQRLNVEIVTENRMVSDALRQNLDSLKESLSKQNIKMDSFDVSTGGNNSGMAEREQDAWRGLTQQRQQNAWMAADGYRLPSVAVNQAQPVYQARSAHSMVDLHF